MPSDKHVSGLGPTPSQAQSPPQGAQVASMDNSVDSGELPRYKVFLGRRMMRKMRMTGILVMAGLITISAQEPMTVRGEIVEVSCYFKLGVEKSTGAGHVPCAKDCVSKGQPLGILTDGDGLIKITGDFSANKYAKLIGYIGRQVELTGTSDRYLDYSRAIRVAKLTPITAKDAPSK